MEFQESDNITPPPLTETENSKIDLSSYDNYYQEEFKKIIASGETYKGKWNWFAFGFGVIWLFTKGAWGWGLLILGIGIFISFVFPAFPDRYFALPLGIVCGKMGTWIYYNVKIKNNQFPS